MKKIPFILILFISVQVLAQTSGKKYSFQEIGWSIVLPSDFTAFPSTDASMQITPGSADQSAGEKRMMMAMNDANSFMASLSSCEFNSEKGNEKFDAVNRNSYKTMIKGLGEGEQCDSATTLVSIGGVYFRKFHTTRRKGNLVKGNFVFLTSCYKGYTISIVMSYFTKKAGEELESMLEQSKFSK